MFRFAMVFGVLALLASSASAQYGSIYGPQQPRQTYGTSNVFGGQNYSNGMSTRSNVFGGQNIYQGGSQVGSSSRNVFGGQNYSNGVTSQPNVFGGQSYSNGVTSRPNVFGGQDLYRGGTRVGSSQKTATGTTWNWFGK